MPSASETYSKKSPGTGRPKGGYRDAEGKRVPGVTTICKHIDANADGLIYWAVGLAQEGKDWKEVRDQSAAQGTAIHDAVSEVSTGKPVAEVIRAVPDKMRAAVAFGTQAYLEWSDTSHLTLLPHERPLVDHALGFGGTPDLVGRDRNGCLHLADIKTGKLYPAAILQVAAYKRLVEAETGEDIVGVHLLRFDRETGAFTHVGLPPDIMEEGWWAFMSARNLYESAKRFKRLL